jgi:two-component system response regulator (stage 0 sporulation protein F)
MYILVVDDQLGLRELLGCLIREEGYHVELAQNGLEAVRMVRRIKPRLIFMDIRMPVMDGLEALTEIKSIAPWTEVIMMTAYISEDIKKQAGEKGARCCILKPFGLDVVRNYLKVYAPLNVDQRQECYHLENQSAGCL